MRKGPPDLLGRLMYRSRLVRRLVVDVMPVSGLRTWLLLGVFAWSYRRFNRTGEVPDPVLAEAVSLIQTAALIDTAGSFTGREGVAAALAELRSAFDDVRFEPRSAIVLDRNRLLVMVRFSASGRGSGLGVDRLLGHLFHVEGGEATRWEVHWEVPDALEAAGLPPTALGHGSAAPGEDWLRARGR